MAIRPPSWCADAIPTNRGWAHPKTGELLKAVKIKDHMIDEWYASRNVEEEVELTPVVTEPVIVHATPEINPEDMEILVELDERLNEEVFEDITEEAVEEVMDDMDTQLEMLTEAPVNNKSLDEMTKRELEDLGRQHGVELDRRKSKKTLVDRMKNLLG